MSEYFPKPNYLRATVKVESDLSNYSAKTDYKNGTGFVHRILIKRLIYLLM